MCETSHSWVLRPVQREPVWLPAPLLIPPLSTLKVQMQSWPHWALMSITRWWWNQLKRMLHAICRFIPSWWQRCGPRLLLLHHQLQFLRVSTVHWQQLWRVPRPSGDAPTAPPHGWQPQYRIRIWQRMKPDAQMLNCCCVFLSTGWTVCLWALFKIPGWLLGWSYRGMTADAPLLLLNIVCPLRDLVCLDSFNSWIQVFISTTKPSVILSM